LKNLTTTKVDYSNQLSHLSPLEDSHENNGSLKFLPVQRQNIFFDVAESEIQDIKNQFEIDEKSSITFLKGHFSNYYLEEDILGEGTSGVVKKCFKVGTNEPFAVKIVQYKGDLEILSLIIKEFLNVKALDHKNVIKVYELYVDYFKKKIYSIMELAECCEMFEVIKDLGHYSEAVASGIFKQILAGVSYLHTNGVCHRDLKPNNILVSKDGKIVKITDFNVSKFLDKTEEKQKFSSLSSENYKMWTNTGTIAFTAPEVFLENEYTERVDIWSAGVVLYIMLCGYQPFQADYVQDLIEIIKEGKYEFHKDQWEHISEQAKDLVKHCLDVNPKTRYTPFDALMHPWVANQGKVSDIKISNVKENFRVYYKKCTSNKKNLASAIQIKKIQVNSPSLHVASPYACRLRKRSGTLRPLDHYLNKNRLSPKLDVREKENKNLESNARIRFREITSLVDDASTKDITEIDKQEPEQTTETNQATSIEIIEGYDSPTDTEDKEFTGRDNQVKKLSFKEKMEDENAKIGGLCIRESSDEDTETPKHSRVTWEQYCS